MQNNRPICQILLSRFKRAQCTMALALMAITICIPTWAFAAPKAVGTFQYWTVYTDDTGAAPVCYAVSQPRKKLPVGAKRGDIFLTITHRPGDGVRYEPGLRIGYPISPKSDPIAQVDNNRFRFFSGAHAKTGADEWAWIEDIDQTSQLIEALRKGSTLTFSATSQRGTQTKDTYSLMGFTRAMEALDEACP
ncbi:invasion associated locus B family protein [Alphaproteobacteria bacterium]|nr:invasion associated locus B family protein [Alphaproteobacteria bacterium]